MAVITGFDGGSRKNPNYEDVVAGKTDYAQAVRVIYNSETLSYQQLLDYYWRHIDPTVGNGQFCDKGHQYRSVIFYLDKKQKDIAFITKREMEKRFNKVYTEVLPSTQFYAADGEQQAYSQRHPIWYRYYLFHCGQNKRISELWL